MKFVFAILLTINGLAAFAQHTIKTDSVYISGKVRGYEKYNDTSNAVIFIITDIVFGRQINFRAKLNNDGTYKIAFLKTGTQDIYISFNENLETIIVSPGDHLQVSFDAGSMGTTLSFGGDNAQTNRDFERYTSALNKENIKLYGNDHDARFYALAASEKDTLPHTHKKFLTDRFNEENAYLKAYIKEHKLTKTFIKWITTDLKCEYLNNLMRYTYIHADKNQLKEADFKVPENYFDFTKTVSLNDPNLALSSNYKYYLEDYARRLRKSANLDDIIALLAQQPNGFAKDVMLSTIINQLIDAKILEIKPYLDTLKSYVSYPVFYSETLAAYNSALNKQKNYKLSAASKINDVPKTEADSLFNKIIAQYRNKVIYIDFWATWCGPCRAEMPNSIALRNSFINKDVVFLYLGVRSEEKTWKALIAELDIKGEHYLLNNKEYATLAEKFQINGIPHYVLVDKAGRVVNGNAQRPGNNVLMPLINELLVAK